ncbi:MAG: hypothetical protein ACREYE_20515 [Gammaproteobacteria bacterium]
MSAWDTMPATELTQAANDKQQVAPMLVTLAELPEDLGKVTELLADAGYFSEANVVACVDEIHRAVVRRWT